MKQHITMENLMELSEYQKDRLNNLWIPQRYDLAAGFLCKNAETNEYDIFEFVIGHMNITEARSGYSVTLMNLEGIRGWGMNEVEAQKENRAQEDTDKEEEYEEEEYEEEEYEEDDFSYEYERPDIYNKRDCMPLLNIGQMIGILNRCEYGKGNFYINYKKDSNGYGVGRDIEEYIDYGTDYNEEELCDALWKAVKEAL